MLTKIRSDAVTLTLLLGLGVGTSGCIHVPDAAEQAELSRLRADYACNPPYGYRALELVAAPDVPLAPKPINKSFAAYPLSALDYMKSGEVKVILAVNEAGHVERVDIAAESPRGCRFAEAAVVASMKLQFAPGASGRYAMIWTFKVE